MNWQPDTDRRALRRYDFRSVFFYFFQGGIRHGTVRDHAVKIFYVRKIHERNGIELTAVRQQILPRARFQHSLFHFRLQRVGRAEFSVLSHRVCRDKRFVHIQFFEDIRGKLAHAGIKPLAQDPARKDDFRIVERIEDGYRKRVELIPMDAYREAVANAIIHRTYDVAANTKIEMYPDKIIISSPGGLLPEISREDFLRGSYSYLRNPIIANVFHRLNIVEIFATGIRRINQSYNDCIMKPTFDLTSSSVSVSLPITSHITLSKNEAKVLSKMNSNYQYTRPELEELTSINKDTMLRVIKSLLHKEVIEKIGKAKSTRYMKK